MTTAGRANAVAGGWTGLCDVPQPEQSARNNNQAEQVCGQHDQSLLSADRRGHGLRCDVTYKRGCVLSRKQITDPLVSAVVDAVDEPHGDDLHREHIDEADADRRGRLPDEHAKGQANCSVDGQNQPDRAEPLGDVRYRGPDQGLAFKRCDHGAAKRAKDEQHSRHDAHPRHEDDHASGPSGHATRTLCEHGLESPPRILRSCKDGAEHYRHGCTQRPTGAQHVAHKMRWIQRRQRHGPLRGPRIQGLVPVAPVEQHGDARDESRAHQECRAKTVLAPLGLDGCDHDPCFSPVSWKKTSSSDLSNGRSSLTPMPTAVSLRFISRLFCGLVLRRIAPSWRLIAAGPNIFVSSSWAWSIGCARTSTPSSPSSS